MKLGLEIGEDLLGAPPYPPWVLLSIFLYGFMTGMRSGHKLETACRDWIP